MSSESPLPYRISWARSVYDAFAILEERAKRVGVLDDLLVDMTRVRQRLQTDPVEWGDPQYHFYHLALLACQATLNLIHIYYAVDKERRIVYIKEICAMPSRSLEE